MHVITKVQSSNTLDLIDEVRSLTSMSGQVATPEQQIDLLRFWDMGHEKFENHIEFLCTKRSFSYSTKEKGQDSYFCLI